MWIREAMVLTEKVRAFYSFSGALSLEVGKITQHNDRISFLLNLEILIENATF